MDDARRERRNRANDDSPLRTAWIAGAWGARVSGAIGRMMIRPYEQRGCFPCLFAANSSAELLSTLFAARWVVAYWKMPSHFSSIPLGMHRSVEKAVTHDLASR
ncbi:MAG: hypothetical protein FWD57_01465 [Polyangiaceae bacterium]|nr:hypothetical protein [Polyangiaceae bacterium]